MAQQHPTSGTPSTSRDGLYGSPPPSVAGGWVLGTVVAPNPLYGSNGIRIAPDGTLWITQVNGDQITAWDPSDGSFSLADPMGSPMTGPDDVAFDSDGTCYVTETLNNRVSARRGDDYIVLLDETTGPNGITVDPSTDRLFVDEMAEGGRVLELDRNERNRARVIVEGLDWLNALERGPDGRLYVPQVFGGVVLAVDVENGAVEQVVDGLAIPTAVKFDPAGRLVIAEAGSGNITRIDLATGERSTVCRPGVSIDNFCFDRDGALYTSNFVEARVERWDVADGNLTTTVGPGGLIGPATVSRWDDDHLVVADHNSIIRVGLDGSLDRVTRLLGNQQFVADGAVVVNGVVVARSLAGEVLVVDPDSGRTTKLVETAGSMTDQLLASSSGGATALAADGDRVLVGIGGDVVSMNAGGGERTVHAFGMASIDAIASGGDAIAAADTQAGTLAIRTATGTVVVDGFDRPEALAFAHGALFVAETGARRITRVALDAGGRDTVVFDAPIGMPRESVRLGRSASMHSDGRTLYLGCDGDGSVRSLRRS